MKAEKTREYLKLMFGEEIVMATHKGIDTELEKLEYKAAELDRREKGVVVIDKGSDYECTCCGGVEGYKSNYCQDCGVRLIWPWDKEVSNE